jgi:hypothetical protein
MIRVFSDAVHRRRRLLVSRWRRTTRWEFWPAWALYAPLMPYIGYLAFKHHGLTSFTAANPSIEAGGFVRESKYDILQGLAGAGPFIARSTLIRGDRSADEKIAGALAFMARHRLSFPIVLKPNSGQRGSGVVIVRSADALASCVRDLAVDTIVQEFVSGDEFGVFYYRRPTESRGRIFSITEKKFPFVIGDGRRTLEQLILDDDRAVCAAPLYLERFTARLHTIPPVGERIPLAELGTHCRGAMFLDGGGVWTQELEDRFEAIAQTFDGFYFGRFDVRVHGGIDAFRAGDGFKIVELNGVTSEATHIYDPSTPLLRAYRVLMEQWRIAFEIGSENRCRGACATPMSGLARLAREYVQIAQHHLPDMPA